MREPFSTSAKQKFLDASHIQQYLILLAAMYVEMSPDAKFVKILKSFQHRQASEMPTFSVSKIDKEITALKKAKWLESTGYKRSNLHEDLPNFEIIKFAYDFDKSFVKSIHAVASQLVPVNTWGYFSHSSSSDLALIRELQMGVIFDDSHSFMKAFKNYHSKIRYRPAPTLLAAYKELMDTLHDSTESGYMKWIGPNVLSILLNSILTSCLVEIKPLGDLPKHVESFLTTSTDEESFADMLNLYGLGLVMTGNFKELKRLVLRHSQHYFGKLLRGLAALLQGNLSGAQTLYQEGIQSYRKMDTRNRHKIPSSSLHFFFFFSSVQQLEKSYHLLKKGQEHYIHNETILLTGASELLNISTLFVKNKVLLAKTALYQFEPKADLDHLIAGFLYHWLETDPSSSFLITLKDIYTRCEENQFLWLQMEFAAVLSKLSYSEKIKHDYQQIQTKLEAELDCVSIINWLTKKEVWERTLLGLEGFLNEEEIKSNEPTNRLVLLLNLDKTPPEVDIKLQSISKKGGWTKGKKAKYYDLRRFVKDFGTKQESNIFNTLSEYYRGNAEEIAYSDFYYNQDDFFKSLVNYPNLFNLKNTKIKIELTSEKPSFYIEETEDSLRIQLNYLPQNKGVNIFKDSPVSYKLVNFTEAQFEMLGFFADTEILFPKQVGSRLTDLVTKIKEVMPVESVLEKDLADLPRLTGDTTPHLHLLPIGQTFQLEFFAKPVQELDRYFKPGKGKSVFTDYVEGNKTVIDRALKIETQKTNALITKLGLVTTHKDDSLLWELTEPEECLEILSLLQPLRIDKEVILEWPKGEKFKLLGSLNSSALSLRISKGKDYWFSLDGELRVSESLVFSLQKLLELSENSKNGFVEVSNGQFLSLTKKFQKQLKTASGLLEKGKGNQLQFHNLAGLALEDVFDDVKEIEADKFWKEQQDKLANAKAIRPRVATSFLATLRPYQKKGFKWMMQLAEWGVGGCLADDMGLGKTIQGLAMLVSRQETGPALVVAPASVCRNWMRETEKFAPTLTPLLFGSSDRQEMVDNLKKGDLLICTYGLMQTEISKLKTVDFGTIILDEAQAIKNFNTKRFKAAIQLQGQFKMATTGTPVENHLGELWSLFQYINPGLLGGKKSFADRFGHPIKNGSKEAMQQLKTLVQPFMLRRRKSQVLKDLPAKTEIIYNIEMSPEEQAFYEAARRNALQKLESGLEEQKAGTQHLMILAEITRMRRACCHPSLVDKTSRLPGAKLEAFKEVIHDLRENGHKVLVFSQFVDYLKIVEKWVIEQRISYQYLDGSTPLKKRELSVNAFQKGEGDLFLISLKAGGVGLNLTEADYVIILDPWWNPAVEDQAADRAHRIGQRRPVTVYRMVIENTIEEKIVQLHSQKRDLADTLLKGSDASTKVTAKDLLKILKDER